MPTVTISPPETKSPPEAPEKKPKKKLLLAILCCTLVAISIPTLIFLGIHLGHEEQFFTHTQEDVSALATVEENPIPSWIDVQLIDPENPSRRGEKLDGVTDIVVHYVANPGTSAQANRNYFASEDTDTSSHFVVGLEGEVILCIPLDEKSSASNHRNGDTISVEVCHPDVTGEFSSETLETLVKLLAWLCEEFSLEKENIIRHYDVTGKMCPLYYVENPDSWETLKASVEIAMQ